MTGWLTDPRRRRSEAAAFEAEAAWAAGDRKRGCALFATAAELEKAVAREVPPSSPRLRSLLAVSACALWYKAGEFERAKLIAYGFLAETEGLTKHGRRELEMLVDRCSREEELSGVDDLVPVEVKLDGGRIKVGVAPAGVARDRGNAATSLLTRSAEYASRVAYRDRGESELGRGEQLQIYEVPAIAASYGLRFYVGCGSRQGTASKAPASPESVVQTFLRFAEAAALGPDAIQLVVKGEKADARYAQAFISGFAELAPDGTDVESVECSAPSWKLPGATSTVFSPEHRTMLRAPTTSGGVQNRQVRARVMAASLTRSTIELETTPSAADEAREKIEGTVASRSKDALRGLVLDDEYDFDLKITRGPEGAVVHTPAKIEILSTTTSRPAEELAAFSGTRRTRPGQATPALRWSKQMTPTDALRNEGNQRPYVQLTQSKHPIDHSTWFRKKLFGSASWGRSGNGEEEEARIPFEFVVDGVKLGRHVLRLSHLPSRGQYHAQPATRLHWSGDVRKTLERNDLSGQFLVLERDTAGHFALRIVGAPVGALT